MADIQSLLLTFLIVCLVAFVISIAIFWKLFEKAGEPGWAAIIPIYNLVVILRILGRPWWLLVLALIPFANIAAAIYFYLILPFDMAKAYGKDAGFGIGLLLLGIVFYPILAFGGSEYIGPVGGEGAGRSRGRSRRSMSRFDDDDDYDDRPRSKSRGRVRDDDDDDRPRGSAQRRIRDDDDDDRDRSRGRDRDEDDEEDERRRRR